MSASSAADARVAAWPSLAREVFVEVDGSFPAWRATEDDARDLLHDSGLPSDGPVVDFEPAGS